jgi:hypothetical protein
VLAVKWGGRCVMSLKPDTVLALIGPTDVEKDTWPQQRAVRPFVLGNTKTNSNNNNNNNYNKEHIQ